MKKQTISLVLLFSTLLLSGVSYASGPGHEGNTGASLVDSDLFGGGETLCGSGGAEGN